MIVSIPAPLKLRPYDTIQIRLLLLLLLILQNSTTQSGSFAKYSDVGLVKISFPVCCVLHRATGLPTGMSHRAA